MAKKTVPSLDVPRVIDSRTDRAKAPHRGPAEHDGPRHAQADARPLHLVQLGGDELDASRKLPQQQVDQCRMVRWVSGEAAEQRESNSNSGKMERRA